MKIKVAPSILSANFSSLALEIKKVEAAGADMLHIDVMDGHFVPNITIGPVVVKDIRKVTSLPLDVHLMIENPEKFIPDFVRAGSDMITVHIEAVSVETLKSLSRKLRAQGVRFAVSLNPATSLNKIKKILTAVDFILVMSVNPGFSGQGFMPSVLPKIRKLRSIFPGDIEVDGGMNLETAKRVINSGANIIAAGTYIFKAKNYAEAIRSLKCLG